MSQFWIKLHMLMLTQPSDTMLFCVCTTKKSMIEAGFYYKHINIFVCNISIFLNIIFPFYPLSFTCPFLYFTWSITPCLRAALDRRLRNYLAKLTSDVRVPVCITIFCHNFLQPEVSKLSLIVKETFANGVEAIYHLYAMSWYTDRTVNNNRKYLWQHWHQV